jgi:Flp pilus assembly protein TadB
VQTAERRTSSHKAQAHTQAAASNKQAHRTSKYKQSQQTSRRTQTEKADRELAQLSTQQAQRSLKAHRARWVSWVLHLRPVSLIYRTPCGLWAACFAVIVILLALAAGPHPPCRMCRTGGHSRNC